MSIGGLATRASLNQKPTKPCERCGLRYPIDEHACPHCKDIKTEADLALFKEHIESQKEAGSNMGSIFFVVALILGVLLYFLF